MITFSIFTLVCNFFSGPSLMYLLNNLNNKKNIRLSRLSHADIFLIGLILWNTILVLGSIFFSLLGFRLSIFFYIYSVIGIFLFAILIIFILKLGIKISQLRTGISIYQVYIVILLFLYSVFTMVVPLEYSWDAIQTYIPYAIAINNIDRLIFFDQPYDFYSIIPFAQTANPPAIILKYSYILSSSSGSELIIKYAPIEFFIILLLALYRLTKEFTDAQIAKYATVIFLSMPINFIYLSSTSLNLELGLFAFSLAAMYFVIRAVKSGNPLWHLFAGISSFLVLLSRIYGIFIFFYIILMIYLLNMRVKFRIVVLLLAFSTLIMFLAKDMFRSHELNESLGLVLIVGFLTFCLIAFQPGMKTYSKIKMSNFSIFTVSVILGFLWYLRNYYNFGSPFYPFILQPFDIDSILFWASNLLSKVYISPVRSFPEMIFLVFSLLIINTLGSLLILPKLYGLGKSISNFLRKRGDSLLLYSFILVLIFWITSKKGNVYVLRYLFLPGVFLSIFTAIGYHNLLEKIKLSRLYHEKLLIILMMLVVVIQFNSKYINFDFSSLYIPRKNLKLLPDMDDLMFSLLVSVLIILGYFIIRNRKIIAPVITMFFLITIINFQGNLCAEMSQYNWDVSKYQQNSLSVYLKEVREAGYYIKENSQNDSKVISFGSNGLAYYTERKVIILNTLTGLGIFKKYILDSNDLCKALVKENIRYILLPSKEEPYYSRFDNYTKFENSLIECTNVEKLKNYRYFKMYSVLEEDE